MIGERIRAARCERGISMSTLAEATGLTSSAISQIERGLIDPSLRSLRAISAALDTPIFALFVEPQLPDIVVRKNERRSFLPPERTVMHELVTPNLQGKLEVIETHLEPGGSTCEDPLPHAGEECLVVLEGVAEVLILEQAYVLQEGDSIYIYEGLPHRVTNKGEGILRTLSALTPAVF